MIINKCNLLENLRNTYCSFGRSEVHGIGVVAIRDIPKGINPLPVIVEEQTLNITEKELENLPKEVSKKIKDIFVGVDGIYQVYNLGLNGLGVTFHVNHSKNPNIAVNDLWFGFCNDQYQFSKLQELIANEAALCSGYYPFITLREIKKGEELFWDYTISDGDAIY